MKKIKLFLTTVILVGILSGCLKQENQQGSQTNPDLTTGSGQKVETVTGGNVKIINDFLLKNGIQDSNSYYEWNKIKFVIPNAFEIYNQTEEQLTISNVSENEWQRVKEINEKIIQEGGGREAENFRIGNLITIRKIDGIKTFDELIKDDLLYTATYNESSLPEIWLSHHNYEAEIFKKLPEYYGMQIKDVAYIKVKSRQHNQLIVISLIYLENGNKAEMEFLQLINSAELLK